MAISSLWIRDFRCFERSRFEPEPSGFTILRGLNGSGKTSVLEAIGWLATGRSIRGATRETLVRRGADRAILRAETVFEDKQDLIEAEIPLARAARTQLNRRTIRRHAEMAVALQVSVFSPADRRLVEGGPVERRDYLDEVLVERSARLEAVTNEVEHVLRQRAALLRQSGGKLDTGILVTLDVWEQRLAAAGTELAVARETLAEELEPLVSESYAHLAGHREHVTFTYRRSWNAELADALRSAREQDVRRQVTTVGPHRDELEIGLGLTSARTHASQGEQRCIALAMRLATHELRLRVASEPPVLLLDDVFSELDPYRSAALVERLPSGQVLLTTAVDPPAAVGAHQVVEVAGSHLLAKVCEQ
ncbi:MAG: DNA replication/repair protein RecF [Acidimicrobiales bacterium]